MVYEMRSKDTSTEFQRGNLHLNQLRNLQCAVFFARTLKVTNDSMRFVLFNFAAAARSDRFLLTVAASLRIVAI